jgi:hypothetical protein
VTPPQPMGAESMWQNPFNPNDKVQQPGTRPANTRGVGSPSSSESREFRDGAGSRSLCASCGGGMKTARP